MFPLVDDCQANLVIGMRKVLDNLLLHDSIYALVHEIQASWVYKWSTRVTWQRITH